MKLTDREIASLAKNLSDFYMGELIPPAHAIRGYYDREWWKNGNNPCTLFRDSRMCIDCHVEYIHNLKSYMGENVLAAHITIYCGNGKYSKQTEYWNCEHVRQFTDDPQVNNKIVISL